MNGSSARMLPRDEAPAEPVDQPETIRTSWRIDVLRPSRAIRVRQAPAARSDYAETPDYRARAMALWPRLDAGKLRRTGGDLKRVARLVEQRTTCSFETIIGMLKRHDRG